MIMTKVYLTSNLNEIFMYYEEEIEEIKAL